MPIMTRDWAFCRWYVSSFGRGGLVVVVVVVDSTQTVCVYTPIPDTHRHTTTHQPHRIAQEYGLIAIPTSAFYAEAHQPTLPPFSDDTDAAAAAAAAPPAHAATATDANTNTSRRPLVRFTFCKTDATLEAAAEVFRRLGRDQRRGGGGGGQ